MRARRVIVAVATTVIAALAVGASAVQTSRFGLAATGSRPRIEVDGDKLPAHESVVVYNRTTAPLTVDLDVVGVTKTARGYDLGASGAGLSAHVVLSQRTVALPSRGRRTVGVTIDGTDNPDADAYAAVTAVEAGAPGGGVSVSERLAVLVKVDWTGAASQRAAGTAARVAAVALAVIALLAVATLWVRRRRRAG